jgi:hypothetical protein
MCGSQICPTERIKTREGCEGGSGRQIQGRRWVLVEAQSTSVPLPGQRGGKEVEHEVVSAKVVEERTAGVEVVNDGGHITRHPCKC